MSSSQVNLGASVREIICTSAERAYPKECCGFLWGLDTTITFAAEVDNVAATDKHVHFEISTDAYKAAERYGDLNGLTLIGVFHSHPEAAAVPSGRDLEMAFPNFLYIIAAVSGHIVEEVRCWALADTGQFTELSLQGS